MKALAADSSFLSGSAVRVPQASQPPSTNTMPFARGPSIKRMNSAYRDRPMTFTIRDTNRCPLIGSRTTGRVDGSASFTSEGVKRLLELRTSDEEQQQMEALAGKANEGLLTPEEHRQYESWVRAGTLMSMLKAKARLYLKQSTTAQ